MLILILINALFKFVSRGGGLQIEDDLTRNPPGRHHRHFGAQGSQGPHLSLFKGPPGNSLPAKSPKVAKKAIGQ
jgi:hypothetical protein